MHRPSSAGDYATAILLDDADLCGDWPECGCNAACERARPFEARPQFLLIEKLLLASIAAGAIVGAWLALT